MLCCGGVEWSGGVYIYFIKDAGGLCNIVSILLPEIGYNLYGTLFILGRLWEVSLNHKLKVG